jgi:hypothetical protein
LLLPFEASGLTVGLKEKFYKNRSKQVGEREKKKQRQPHRLPFALCA